MNECRELQFSFSLSYHLLSVNLILLGVQKIRSSDQLITQFSWVAVQRKNKESLKLSQRLAFSSTATIWVMVKLEIIDRRKKLRKNTFTFIFFVYSSFCCQILLYRWKFLRFWLLACFPSLLFTNLFINFLKLPIGSSSYIAVWFQSQLSGWAPWLMFISVVVKTWNTTGSLSKIKI